MKIGAIVQAHMGSIRLPNKIMKRILGKTVLALTLERIKRIRLLDEIIVATTISKEDDIIVEEVKNYGKNIKIFRGSEKDVLDRYYQAAKMFFLDVIVRITSDCPLIDPRISNKIIEEFLANDVDFCSNVSVRTFPKGLDIEVFSVFALEQAWQDIQSGAEREGVTPFGSQRLNVTNDCDLSYLRWVLDYPEDFEFISRIYEKLYPIKKDFGMYDVLGLLLKEPDLLEINKKYTNQIYIRNKRIGIKSPVFIVAEIGSNHNQNIQQTKKLVDIVKNAGADAVKFQSFEVKTWISHEATFLPSLKQCELPYSMYAEIKSYAEEIGLICFSTPSQITDVDKLEEIGISLYKIGSCQITDLPTIEYIAKQNKPIILATGASNLDEISVAVNTIKSTGNSKIALLHCTVLYPTPLEKVNLNAMQTIKDSFPDLIIGYSDHTLEPTLVPVMAVTMGARIIEKHITLDRKTKGPDHSFALEPNEFCDMVTAIRNAESILGSSDKKLLNEEKEIIKMSRRSLVAKRDIKKGVLIQSGDLTTKRPGWGIAPKFFNQVVGKIAKENITQDTILKWEDLDGN